MNYGAKTKEKGGWDKGGKWWENDQDIYGGKLGIQGLF